MDLVGYVRDRDGKGYGVAHDWKLVQYPMGYRKPNGRKRERVLATYVEWCKASAVTDIVRRSELRPAVHGDPDCRECLGLRRGRQQAGD